MFLLSDPKIYKYKKLEYPDCPPLGTFPKCQITHSSHMEWGPNFFQNGEQIPPLLNHHTGHKNKDNSPDDFISGKAKALQESYSK